MIPELHFRSHALYPGSSVHGFVGPATRVEIIEETGKHTLFLVRHEGHAKFARESLRSGAPMRVGITARKGTRIWHGYVDSVTPAETADNMPYTNVVGVGTTYPMKEPAVSVLDGVVDSERRLIKRAGLVPIVRGPEDARQVLVAGRSQWEVLTETAAQYSQYVFATGTTVNVLQLKDIIDLYQQEAVTLVWSGSAGHMTSPYALRRFRIPQTDNTGGLGLVEDRRIGFGVDPLTARVTVRDEGTSMFPRYQDFIARSFSNVADRFSGSTVSHQAEAEGRGHIGVTAGKLVFIRGSDPGPWWLVQRVSHVFESESNEYEMRLSLLHSADLKNMPKEVFAPQRNIHRKGDSGENVALEMEPMLHIGKRLVKGSVSWQDSPRWRPR